MECQYPEDTIAELASHFESIIRILGEDPDREGLKKTPMRAAKALYYATNGYRMNMADVINGAIFTSPGSQLIIVKDIEYYSFCEHHILPFFGKVSIGYIPDGRMIGLSKLARIVDLYARRLQVQERLTSEICRAVTEQLGAKGVIVACTGEHLCMKMRGGEKQDSSTTTIEMSGVFNDNYDLQRQFFESLKV